MLRAMTNNLDYLATRLHARRSRMAEGDRLDALCNIRTIPELGRSIRLDVDYQAAVDLQRRLVQDLVAELAACVRHVGDAGGELFAWMLVRFQVENMKVLVRGFVNRTPLDELKEHLVALPEGLVLNVAALATAASLEDFAGLLPEGAPRQRLTEAIAIHRDHPRPFFLETALDCGYFQELLAKTRQLSGEDLAIVRSVSYQEANLFQFMFVVRGKFHYNLASESLWALRIPGLSEDWFKTLLTVPDMLSAARAGLGVVLDEMPAERTAGDSAMDPAVLEALAWKRFLRVANSAFRRGSMGLGAVVGYAGIRRVEVANLITLSEGIRTGLTAGAIRARLVPRRNREAAHV